MERLLVACGKDAEDHSRSWCFQGENDDESLVSCKDGRLK